MSGFDEAGIFFSDNFGGEDDAASQMGGDRINRVATKKRFKDFIRQFHLGTFDYVYRDQLKRKYNLQQYNLEVDLEDLTSFDEKLRDLVLKQPADYLPLFEDGAKEGADEITHPRPADQADVQDIQVMIYSSSAIPSGIRTLKSDQVAQLVHLPGIVIAASGIKAKATKIAIQCRTCQNLINDIKVNPGLEGYALPRKCTTDQPQQQKCPLDPYFIVPDKCKCVDFQTLKLQEVPEEVPNGEMPRHMQLYVDRYLCDKMVPGNRVTVTGIYSIKKIVSNKSQRGQDNVGIRQPYLRVIGVKIDTEKSGKSASTSLSPADEEEIRRLAATPGIYDRIARSIAPSIFGSIDIKKAIAVMLFGGSRKKLPDGLTRRGDINMLLLGDPGTAKSQLLKFVERVSPIGVYTSGKGSSAAGLTASVNRDPATRNFVMEGGAMVLADGGVVCIDEFDKMREDDRVAIHEAMEQQTISIAKAGITTTLNSRCSVFAAANSIYGRWDETKGEENIDFMPTILSRFDMIFVVKDEHNEERDLTLAKHVMGVHMNALTQRTENLEGDELSLQQLKKFIMFARSRCGPRLSESAGDRLRDRYVRMRGGVFEHEKQSGKRNAIPITVRQLEAIIRMSESLAKMQLQAFATEQHVEESLRLFQVSTLDAAMSGNLAGAEGFTTEEDQEELNLIEKQLKRRFVIGSQVSEHAIVQDFVKQKHNERAVMKVLHMMLRRGEIQHRMQRKMLFRVK